MSRGRVLRAASFFSGDGYGYGYEDCRGPVTSYGYGYGYEDCRGHPGAQPIRYYAHSTLSGSTVGRYVLVRLCLSLRPSPTCAARPSRRRCVATDWPASRATQACTKVVSVCGPPLGPSHSLVSTDYALRYPLLREDRRTETTP